MTKPISKYTYEEAKQASLKYFDGNEMPADIFVGKYALRDNEGNYIELTPDDMHRRMAKEFARIEKGKFKEPLTEEQIYDYFKKFERIIPQGSIMYGLGNYYQYVSLSNCNVLSEPEDSYGSILKTDQEFAHASKRRLGCGINLDKIRPVGTRVSNSAGTTTGVTTFMERYSNTCREVGQCIEENQRVLTKEGLIPIKDVELEDEVWTKEGWIRVVDKFDNGVKKVYKITSELGYEIEVTAEHKMVSCQDGELFFVKAKDLKEGDNVVLIPGTETYCDYVELKPSEYVWKSTKPERKVKMPRFLNEELAYLLGYSYGDGFVSTDKMDEPLGVDLCCSHDYPQIEDDLRYIIESEFETGCKTTPGGGRCNIVSMWGKKICDFLQINGLLKEKSHTITMPEKIFQSPQSVQAAFLAGYFDADGYNGKNKAGWCFSSVNKEFLLSCKSILMSMGIVSNVHREDRSHIENWSDIYSLVVTGSYSKSLFRDKVCRSYKVGVDKTQYKYDFTLTPFRAKSLSIKPGDYNYVPDNSQNLSLNCMSRLKQENDLCEILVKDTVKSIEPLSPKQTYDIGLEREHRFYCEGFYVKNSGRRAALMETLSVHHPEVLNFATIKNDDKKVTGANISLKMTDEFFEALDNNKDYELRFPVDSDQPKISQMVSAKRVWDTIIDSARLRAEPGVLMWDNILRESIPNCYPQFREVSTNPSLKADTLILTDKGWKQIQELENRCIKVMNINGEWALADCFMTAANSELLEVKFSHGKSVFCTKEHKWVVDGKSKPTVELKRGDRIVYWHGSYLSYSVVDSVNETDIKSDVYDITVFDDTHTFMTEVGVTGNCCFSKEHPVMVITKKGLKEIQQITSDDLVWVDSEQDYFKTSGYFEVGEYQTYKLELSSGECFYVTCNHKFECLYNEAPVLVSLLDMRVGDKVVLHGGGFCVVESISKHKIEPVGCIEVETHHKFTANGVISGNSEIPLCSFDTCRLLLLNLMGYVKHPFCAESYFDFQAFKHDCKIAQRLMDDVVDLEIECIDRIIQKVHSDPEDDFTKQIEINLWKKIRGTAVLGRRTGTGMTAVGDALSALGILYDSTEGIRKTEEIYNTHKLACYESSVDMAEELGAFPIWDHSLEKKNPFLLRIKNENPDLYTRMKKHGRRNIALLTTAPCGTVSMLASSKDEEGKHYWGTTSGIEPVFSVQHTRRRKINPQDKQSRVDFVDELGDKWMEYPVYHPQVHHYIKVTGDKNLENGSWVEANNIDWEKRVELLSRAGRNVDHAISVTINTPNNVTHEEISSIYRTANKLGVKGITVYRDGCRSGVLVTKRIKKTDAPKRPPQLPCEVFGVSVKGDKYTVFVGLMDNDPYEVMAYSAPSGYKNGQEGVIKKASRGRYQFMLNGEVEIDSITGNCSPEQEALTRAISMSLRHGVDIAYVVHQLEKTTGDMQTFAKALARTLKRYISEGFKVSGVQCECGSSNIARQEGCFTCLDCGSSKCG